MKILLKLLLCCASISGVAMLSHSCTNNNDDNRPPVLAGNSIFVPNVADTTVTVHVNMDADWHVSNQETWFAVNPLAGNAGEATLNISVLEANSELKERTGSFVVQCGEEVIQYYVFQDVTDGFDIVESMACVDETEQTFYFTVEGNVKYEAVPEVDWITVKGIVYDSTLLEDQTNYSKYMTSHIELAIAANSGDVREGMIALNGNNGSSAATITVGQWGDGLDADFSRTFLRHSFLVKHTADWCAPCGKSSEYIHDTMEERPGRMLWAGFYQSCNEKSLSAWSGAASYFRETSSAGIPTCVMNNYCVMIGAYPSSTLVALLDEAAEEAESETAVGGYAAVKDGNIEVDLRIASRLGGDYKVSVFVLEDSLQYYQAGIGSSYIHDNVTRAEMTETWGEPVTVAANSVHKMSFSSAVPSYVENEDNLHVYAVIYREGSFTGSVSGLTYNSLKGLIVDNAVDIPANRFKVFEYED